MGEHLTLHGDGVKDVAFEVEDLDAIMERAKGKNCKVVKNIWEESDEHGTVRFATVQTYGDTTHTFVERGKYNGLFLPGYKAPRMKVRQPSERTSILDKLDGPFDFRTLFWRSSLPVRVWSTSIMWLATSLSCRWRTSPSGRSGTSSVLMTTFKSDFPFSSPLQVRTESPVPSLLVSGRHADPHSILSSQLHRHRQLR